ncbi:MAG: hypothetical protein OEM03_08035 [Chromatiales bacterium]|nr:hypothetical protein [Chromatiales bacterium]
MKALIANFVFVFVLKIGPPGQQDWELWMRAQRGAQSRGYRPGKYHPKERAVWAFDDWYLGFMGL